MMISKEHGFSLIEVLIAITIFAVGMLALAQMQIVSMKGNTTARDVTEATSLAQSKIEQLMILPYDHADLQDIHPTGDPHHGQLGLNATGTDADASQQGVSILGETYDLWWNIAEDDPMDKTKTVRVAVTWETGLQNKRITLSFVKADSGFGF